MELPSPESVKGPAVVKSAADAALYLQVLRDARDNPPEVPGDTKDSRGRVFAVSCEVDRQGPEDRLACLCIYAGEDVDFGGGSILWVDADAMSADGADGNTALVCFREFFEDRAYRKAYHNYSAVCRELRRHGVGHSGFAGDTMHMARVWDASLKFLQVEGDSLQKLAGHCLGPEYHEGLRAEALRKTDGRLKRRPLQLQTADETRDQWIRCSSWAAVCVLHLRRDLSARLRALPCRPLSGSPPGEGTMLDFYDSFWLKFGEMLGEIERRGLGTDVEILKAMEGPIAEERADLEKKFHQWAIEATSERFGPSSVEDANLHALKCSSDTQIRTLLFGGEPNKTPSKGRFPEERVLPGTKEAEPAGGAGREEEIAASPSSEPKGESIVPTDYNKLKVGQLKDLLRARGLLLTGTKAVLVDRLEKDDQGVEQKRSLRSAGSGSKVQKVRLRGLRLGLPVIEFTEAGWPSVSASALLAMAHKLSDADGDLQSALGGARVASALRNLARLKEIDGSLDFFLRPLQEHIHDGRIHSSFNLNTETGRLSSRDPNLQNQPAGKSQVRKAFVATEGNALVVADYGQLELRILAHLTSCTSMVEALNSGGDFHSRTAAMMFSEVKAAVDKGRVRLDGVDKASDSLPTVKEKFGVERNRAKTLNFSILYGKTAFGLSQDWGVTSRDAEKIIADWYEAYPEIEQWQNRIKEEAMRTGVVKTLLGRSRPLPGVCSENISDQRHALRAAINTPVQGSAADIVTVAMLRLDANPELRRLGYHMVHQVHDEVLMEGPEVHADLALELVRELMENPLPFPLEARLVVDARTGKNWHDAKPE